jgi:7,8-dihydropterin-6-yl-methyl-4-(beta-D-ribofuranosyl)aminobenzene 5'-phosphate synthase
MQVKVLFDKETSNKDLHTGWGVSFLIDDRILFDTGENSEWLIDNMNKLNLEIDKLQAIAISHEHWDHTGGLWEILKRRQLKVYGCPNFSKGFIGKIKELGSEFISVDKVTEISPEVYLSGEISGFYAGVFLPEQAIIMKTEKGISVLTGCSHPGILKILEKVKSNFIEQKFYLVAGGFHLIDEDKRLVKIIVEEFKKFPVSKVGPTHCSGKEVEEIFKKEYKDNFIHILVGEVLEV